MATVFGNQGNDFYTAFYEPDPVKRRAALDEWIKIATPAIQAAVSDELKAFVEWVTQNRWSEAGWKAGNEKLHRIQNDYPLVMDIKCRKLAAGEQYKGELPKPVYYKPAPAVTAPVIQDTNRVSPAGRRPEDYGDDDDYDDGGRSSNDDRSDSMNPNNDAHQAAMDNHSNQMNPNNDAYWSSRGR